MPEQQEIDFSLPAHRNRVLSNLSLPSIRHKDGTLCKPDRLKSVLRYIAACSSGKCFARLAVIAEKLDLSTKSISRCLRCLTDSGLLLERAIGGRRKEYRICWANILNFEDDNLQLDHSSNGREVRFKQTSGPIQTDVGSVSNGREVRFFSHKNKENHQPTSEVLEAVEILSKYVSDGTVRMRLAQDHTADVADVVAEFELNRHLFNGGGAIKYRLETGQWPTDKLIRTVESMRRQKAMMAAKAADSAAEEQRIREESHRLDSLEREFGSVLDSMSESDRLELARSVVGDLESYQRCPGVFRKDLLESISCQ